MQSQEYPDLPFVQSRWYTKGRSRSVQLIVIHHTAGSEGRRSAEDGAKYDSWRPEKVSCHYFCDQDSTVQTNYTWNEAWSAHGEGNDRGIHYELCGTLQTRAQWLDPASDGTLWQAARQIARDCKKYGIPVRRLTIAQMRAGQKGICGHGDVTAAWHQGDHTDPGPHFPWDVLLARVNQALNNPSGDAEMNAEESRMLRNIAEWVGAQLVGRDTVTGIAPGPGNPHNATFPNTVLNAAQSAAAGVADLKSAPSATVQLDAAAVDALAPVVEAAVRKVLREGTDGAAPGNG